jgi:hypothetical protein
MAATECKSSDRTAAGGYSPGKFQREGTSHKVYKTPWQGDPRVNIQRGKDGSAKAYQVRQVLAAIARLEAEKNEEGDDDA